MICLGYHVAIMPQLIELPSNCDLLAYRYFEAGHPKEPEQRWAMYLKHIKPAKRTNPRMIIAFGDYPRPILPFMVKVPKFWLPPGWEESVQRANKSAAEMMRVQAILNNHRIL